MLGIAVMQKPESQLLPTGRGRRVCRVQSARAGSCDFDCSATSYLVHAPGWIVANRSKYNSERKDLVHGGSRALDASAWHADPAG